MSKQANDWSRAAAQRAVALASSAGTAIAGPVAAVAAALLVALPSLAIAGPDDGPPRRDNQQQQSGRDNRWGDTRDSRSFEARAEEQRRLMQENANNAEISRRMSRMTPDERRDLRRQIDDARIEVYSNTPRR
jgi:hypothetical protein